MITPTNTTTVTTTNNNNNCSVCANAAKAMLLYLLNNNMAKQITYLILNITLDIQQKYEIKFEVIKIKDYRGTPNPNEKNVNVRRKA